jgi:uncharacterized protein involved in exopolysaccharide biosynthesis
VESFATALPQVYLEQVQGTRVGELKAALNFARRRMKEQTANLQEAESALEQFKKRRGVIDPQIEQEQAVEEAGAARAAVRGAESTLASAQAQLTALEGARASAPGFVETPLSTTNPEIASLKIQIEGLRGQRAQLLFLYKPSDDEVRKVDLQIEQLRRRLARTSATVTTVNRAPNPVALNLQAQITDARTAVRTAEAALAAARRRSREIGAKLPSVGPNQRISARLQRNVDVAQESLAGLSKSIEDLTLREQAAEAKNRPVTIIAAAGPAVQVSPRIGRNIVMAIVLGIMLACGMAFVQHALDDHVSDEDEVTRLVGTPTLATCR